MRRERPHAEGVFMMVPYTRRRKLMLTRTVLEVACGSLLFGCRIDTRDDADHTQESVDNLVKAGFPPEDVMVVDGLVYTGRDAVVSLEASQEMLEVDGSTPEEQYRTTNIVGTNITTICVNGTAFTNFSTKFSNALNQAIANYNDLGLRFTMRRTTGSTTGCSATITGRVNNSTGGVSGFPSGGRPFNTINIGNGLNSSQFGVNTVAHVMTHELGHTLGMRHSDFFNLSI